MLRMYVAQQYFGLMASPWVVVVLNPGEYGEAYFAFGRPAMAVDQLALQTGKEALCHGVIVSIANIPMEI